MLFEGVVIQPQIQLLKKYKKIIKLVKLNIFVWVKNILLLILKTNKHSEFYDVYVKIKKIRQQINNFGSSKSVKKL